MWSALNGACVVLAAVGSAVGIDVETGPSVGLTSSSCVEGAEGAGEGAADVGVIVGACVGVDVGVASDGTLVDTSINRVGNSV